MFDFRLEIAQEVNGHVRFLKKTSSNFQPSMVGVKVLKCEKK